MRHIEKPSLKSKQQLKLEKNYERLIHVVKMAYRKHSLDDNSIWKESLNYELYNTLVDVIGEEEVRKLQQLEYFNNNSKE